MKKFLKIVFLLLFAISIYYEFQISNYYCEETVEYNTNPTTDSKQIIENAVEVFNVVSH
jgi:hypothetical protein